MYAKDVVAVGVWQSTMYGNSYPSMALACMKLSVEVCLIYKADG